MSRIRRRQRCPKCGSLRASDRSASAGLFLCSKLFHPCGAGPTSFWRRWATVLAQVGFLGGDLHRKSLFYALQWRRSTPFFPICARNAGDLRRDIGRRIGPLPEPTQSNLVTNLKLSRLPPKMSIIPICVSLPVDVQHFCISSGLTGVETLKTIKHGSSNSFYPLSRGLNSCSSHPAAHLVLLSLPQECLED